jgi:hypothetical protein
LRLLTLPLPVIVKRLAALLLVLILGIISSWLIQHSEIYIEK